jgi:hypothetical protein
MNEGANKPSVEALKQNTSKLENTQVEPTIQAQPKEEK